MKNNTGFSPRRVSAFIYLDAGLTPLFDKMYSFGDPFLAQGQTHEVPCVEALQNGNQYLLVWEISVGPGMLRLLNSSALMGQI